MCYITDRQNETHHCRPYVGHKTKTPAGWDLLGFSYLPKTVFCGCAAWGGLFLLSTGVQEIDIDKRAKAAIIKTNQDKER